MSRAHFTLLSSFLVAIVVLPAGAQTPVTTPTDSAATDSVVPKKKSRFGGMMDKAKAVAGNKAVQNAAKGAVTNVACTAVPGAAVVSAATGTGPCANSGLAGLLKGGGIAGAATSIAGGAAANAAAKAAGNLTGVKGAAATGALGAVGGQGGLKNAAAAAAASAMLGKGGAAVTGNAAAMAAAQAAAAGMMSGTGTAALKKGAKTTVPAGADMAGAMAAMGAAMGTVNAAGNNVEAVDFRELKALLPESLRGMKRTEATGQKQAAMGIQISNAEGRYSSEDGKSVTLTVTDMGSMTGLAGATMYAWATTEVDREGDGGYEKTTTFKGFKALEKYDRQSKSGELAVLIEGRFVVAADGNSVDMEAIKAALGSVDLKKIAGMKNKGVKK